MSMGRLPFMLNRQEKSTCGASRLTFRVPPLVCVIEKRSVSCHGTPSETSALASDLSLFAVKCERVDNQDWQRAVHINGESVSGTPMS